MAAQAGGGCVIQMLDSRIARAEPGPFQAYAATKRELAESVARLARECAPRTRVNGVAPGPVLVPEGVREGPGEIPLGRRPTPEDVARAVAFLAESESVTGQILFVDGGQHLAAGAQRRCLRTTFRSTPPGCRNWMRRCRGFWRATTSSGTWTTSSSTGKLALPYAEAAKRDGRKLVYFRFAQHARLVPEGFCEECRLEPEAGFEVFLHKIHEVVGDQGLGAYYLFDCLSDLATNWCSDAMLGNFFMLTCPYLYRLETIAYFGLLRGRHSRHAVEPVRSTTQLFLEVYGHGGKLFLLPIKTQFRHSPTIHQMLEWDGAETFSIVRSSALLTQVMGRVLPNSARIETYGDDVVRRAEECLRAGQRRPEAEELKRQLVGMMVTRDESILPLVDKYLTLEDVLEIRWRMAGTGLIGGKTVGMLLARKIAERECPALGAKLEVHDSFYIGSDVFYTFLVRNGLWEIREKQHSPGHVPRRRGGGAGADPDRQVLEPRSAHVREDAGLFRAVSGDRALELAAGGRLRQFVRGQIRQRVLREPGRAGGAPAVASSTPSARSMPAA